MVHGVGVIKAYLAVSLDGYVARADGSLDWLTSLASDGDFGFADFLATVDAVVLGRRTFETVLAFDEWPYPVPVFVWTSDPSAVPPTFRDRVEAVSGGPTDVVRGLAARGLTDLYVDGGRTVGSFLAAGLLDELHLATAAVVLGGGRPLWPAGATASFEVVRSETLTERLTRVVYRRAPR